MNKEEKTKVRTICVDGDHLDITFQFDEQWNVWLGEYPFFKEEPRYTSSGRPWRNVTYTECPHHEKNGYNDCGTCMYLKKAEAADLIGVCFNDAMRTGTVKQNE